MQRALPEVLLVVVLPEIAGSYRIHRLRPFHSRRDDAMIDTKLVSADETRPQAGVTHICVENSQFVGYAQMLLPVAPQ